MEVIETNLSSRISVVVKNGIRVFTIDFSNNNYIIGKQSLGGAWKTHKLLLEQNLPYSEIYKIPLILNSGAVLLPERTDFLSIDYIYLPHDNGANIIGLEKYYQNLFSDTTLSNPEETLLATDVIKTALGQNNKFYFHGEVDSSELATIAITEDDKIYIKKEGDDSDSCEFVGHLDKIIKKPKIGLAAVIKDVFYYNNLYCSGLVSEFTLPMEEIRRMMPMRKFEDFLFCLQFNTDTDCCI